MNAVPFDTHRMVKRLVAAGFSDAQAETVTDVVQEARQFDLESLATKADLAELKADLKAAFKADIGQLRTDLTAGLARVPGLIAESRNETIRWVIGLMIAQTGLIVALLRLVPAH